MPKRAYKRKKPFPAANLRQLERMRQVAYVEPKREIQRDVQLMRQIIISMQNQLDLIKDIIDG